MKQRSPLFTMGVLSFCAWQSRDLFDAWRHAPFDRLDPVAFIIWLSPVAFAWARGRTRGASDSTLLLITAAASMLGAILDINVVQQLALALAFACLLPVNASHTLWLLASVAWMPVFGWGSSAWGLTAVIACRLSLALAAAAWECRLLSSANGVSIP